MDIRKHEGETTSSSSASKRLEFDSHKNDVIVLDEEITVKLPPPGSSSVDKQQTIDDEKSATSCLNDKDISLLKITTTDDELKTDKYENEKISKRINLPNVGNEESLQFNTDKASTSSIESSHNITNTDVNIINGKNDKSGSGTDVVFRPSSLVRKGKKRFRNLPPAEETQRRNSPRLNKVIDETFDEANNSYEAPIAKLKSLVSEKRRRLNSCGDFIGGENGDEQPDYVRITRSRVSSCT